MSEEYTEGEKREIRRQLKDGIKQAVEVAKRRGVKIHPRVAAIKAAAEAMRSRRRELIAQPLDRIWDELAKAALTATVTAQTTRSVE